MLGYVMHMCEMRPGKFRAIYNVHRSVSYSCHLIFTLLHKPLQAIFRYVSLEMANRPEMCFK